MTDELYRDGLEYEQITKDHYRRWYEADRYKPGTSWVPSLGGAVFTPNIGISGGWELAERDGECMVLVNPDSQARRADRYRLCYDGGFDGYMVLAFSLRPEYAYRFDTLFNAFIANPGGDYRIVGTFPDFFVKGTGKRVYIGPGLRFYWEPQDDVFELAKYGKLGSMFDPPPEGEKPKVTIRRCKTCNGILPADMKRKDIYCSPECGKNSSASSALSGKFKCVQCGTDFKRQGSGNYHYCSDACSRNAKTHKKAPIEQGVCAHCSNVFVKKTSRQRFCSHFCRQGSHRYKTFSVKKIRTDTCQHCFARFKYSAPGPARRYCSDFCKNMKVMIDGRK